MELIKKTEQIIFYLLLIFLPTQLGWHFWPDWAMVNGRRIDYFSPTLYLTDILIISLLFLEGLSWIYNRSLPRQIASSPPAGGLLAMTRKKNLILLVLLTLLFLLISFNIVFSLSPAVSLYKWLKVLEFAFLFWYLQKNFSSLISHLSFLLPIPVFYESLLSIWQFWQQASVGGFWYWLGERTFNSGTPGIARIIFDGQLLLRPYGTFSHPNVLGGWLAVMLTTLISNLSYLRSLSRFKKALVFVILFLGFMALFLSFSRSAIFVGLAATVVIIFKKIKTASHKILFALPVLFTSLVLLPVFFNLGTEKESTSVRQQLNDLSIRQFLNRPLIGTGLGTASLYSLSTTDYQLQTTNYSLFGQPTHNIYLLWLAETGIVGTVIILILGYKFLTNHYELITNNLLLFLVLALLGLFDHYLLTQQHGQLLLVFVLASFACLKRR